MEVQRIETGYQPREFQKTEHSRRKRFNVLVCHRRWGKTIWAVNEVVDALLNCPLHEPQYAYVASTFGQCERVVWKYFVKYTKNIPGAHAIKSKLIIEIPRPWKGDTATIYLLGSDNPTANLGMYLDGLILDEYGELTAPEELFGRILGPMLSDRKGWAIVIGTVKGKNAFYRIWNKARSLPDIWHHVMYKASQTKIIDAEELATQRAHMGDEYYMGEFECDWDAGVSGAYFVKEFYALEKDGKITEVPYDKNLSVDIFLDIGVSDTTAVWFVQKSTLTIRCVDYMEDSGFGASTWCKMIRERGYDIRTVYLPHDAVAREFSSDAHSTADVFEGHGFNVEIVPRVPNIMHRIDAIRSILNKCYFDVNKCNRGIEALRNYKKKWDSKNQIYSSMPVHDWSSHGTDAFGAMALVYGGVQEMNQEMDPRKIPKVMNEWDEFML